MCSPPCRTCHKVSVCSMPRATACFWLKLRSVSPAISALLAARHSSSRAQLLAVHASCCDCTCDKANVRPRPGRIMAFVSGSSSLAQPLAVRASCCACARAM